jgi:hypothetical protein
MPISRVHDAEDRGVRFCTGGRNDDGRRGESGIALISGRP